MEKLFYLPYQIDEKEAYELKLIISAKKGDHIAFSKIYKSYKVYLYKIAYSYVKNKDDALDILQECSYKSFLNINKLSNPENFKTWITRITINTAIDFMRKQKNIVHKEDDLILDDNSKAISIEEKLDLYNAIDLLKDNQKTVIILKYFNNMSIDEISTIMNAPKNTVKSYLKRARESLNNILRSDYLSEEFI